VSNPFRSYEKLKGKRTYWNLRITPHLKEKAQLIAYRLGVSPAKIARDGIETELIRLEGLLDKEISSNGAEGEGEGSNEVNEPLL